MSSKIWGIFCEADGSPSFGRIGSMLALLSVILWGMIEVYHTHKMPTLPDGTTGFIGVSYGLNKMAKVGESIGKKEA